MILGENVDAVGTAAIPLVAGASVLGFLRWLMTRHADQVTEFRKALDRGLRRENGLVVCCEHLVYAIDHIDNPPAQVIALRARAADVLEQTQRQIYGSEQ